MAALDRKLRETTQAELKALQRELGMTFIIVTHDQEEAMIVADRIGVMNAGRLAQVGSPRELYSAPNSRWIAGFVGDVNLIEGVVAGAQNGVVQLQTQDAGRILVATKTRYARGAPLAAALRPELIRLGPDSGVHADANCISGTLIDSSYLGAFSLCRVRLPSGAELRVRSASDLALTPGQEVSISFPVDASVLLET
jgi:putrescine transport system ATP-binding protein